MTEYNYIKKHPNINLELKT